MSWGVCCIVFYIDGMLFEFFMNFFVKKIYLEFVFVSFHVFFGFYAISNIFSQFSERGGGGGYKIFFMVLASKPVGGRSRAK